MGRTMIPIAKFPDAVQVILRKMHPDAGDMLEDTRPVGMHCHCNGCGRYPLCFHYSTSSLDWWVEQYQDWPIVHWPSHMHACEQST